MAKAASFLVKSRNAIAAWIWYCMKNQGLSVEDVAEKIGYSATTVSADRETGRMSTDRLALYEMAFGISAATVPNALLDAAKLKEEAEQCRLLQPKR